ncbi:ribosomal protein S18 acetylase RimI-like enzyme [Mycobacterium sp. BK086]|nr:ribosomal protein S18 acetylase RimI-like enzyme [Mycobacterium sp. BK086]
MNVVNLLRPAVSADAAFIVEMARYVCVIEDWPLPGIDEEDVQSLLPDRDGITVIAVDQGGDNVGAVWTFWHHPPLLTGTDGAPLPEIGIAVVPERRGHGVGSALLDAMFARATATYAAVSLNVHQRNPARRLYERKGFHLVGQGRGDLGLATVR